MIINDGTLPCPGNHQSCTTPHLSAWTTLSPSPKCIDLRIYRLEELLALSTQSLLIFLLPHRPPNLSTSEALFVAGQHSSTTPHVSSPFIFHYCHHQLVLSPDNYGCSRRTPSTLPAYTTPSSDQDNSSPVKVPSTQDQLFRLFPHLRTSQALLCRTTDPIHVWKAYNQWYHS